MRAMVELNEKNQVKTIDTWHIIDGKYIHIYQNGLDTDKPKFYTNCVLEQNSLISKKEK